MERICPKCNKEATKKLETVATKGTWWGNYASKPVATQKNLEEASYEGTSKETEN